MTDGKWGGTTGYYFDASENYLTDLTTENLTEFTIEVWAKPMTGGYTAHQSLTSSYTGDGADNSYGHRSNYIMYHSSEERWYYEVRGQGTGWLTETQSNNSSPAGEWYFLQAIYDGSSFKLYVDEMDPVSQASQ